MTSTGSVIGYDAPIVVTNPVTFVERSYLQTTKRHISILNGRVHSLHLSHNTLTFLYLQDKKNTKMCQLFDTEFEKGTDGRHEAEVS